jgi:PleD family two-component response regulator
MDARTIGHKRHRHFEEKQMQNKKHESSNTNYIINALLVDGVTKTRRLEHNMLESIGVRTKSVIGAQEAIQLLLTGVKFDFIFVDFDLSSGPQVPKILFSCFYDFFLFC